MGWTWYSIGDFFGHGDMYVCGGLLGTGDGRRDHGLAEDVRMIDRFGVPVMGVMGRRFWIVQGGVWICWREDVAIIVCMRLVVDV